MTRYAIGSVVALATSMIVFAVMDWMGSLPAICSAAASSQARFQLGAEPQVGVEDDRPRRLHGEIVAYIVISLAVWGASSWATGVTQSWVNQHVARGDGLRVMLVTGAYVFVQAVFFLVKYVIYDKWVFAGRSRVRAALRSRHQVGTRRARTGPVAEVPALLGAGCVLAAIAHRGRHLGQTITV